MRGVLPGPYALNVDDLQQSEFPDYGGGFGEVWKGRHDETVVAIKKLKGVTAVHFDKRKEVRRFAQALCGGS